MKLALALVKTYAVQDTHEKPGLGIGDSHDESPSGTDLAGIVRSSLLTSEVVENEGALLVGELLPGSRLVGQEEGDDPGETNGSNSLDCDGAELSVPGYPESREGSSPN